MSLGDQILSKKIFVSSPNIICRFRQNQHILFATNPDQSVLIRTPAMGTLAIYLDKFISNRTNQTPQNLFELHGQILEIGGTSTFLGYNSEKNLNALIRHILNEKFRYITSQQQYLR